jgi:hypothetical protein
MLILLGSAMTSFMNLSFIYQFILLYDLNVYELALCACDKILKFKSSAI